MSDIGLQDVLLGRIFLLFAWEEDAKYFGLNIRKSFSKCLPVLLRSQEESCGLISKVNDVELPGKYSDCCSRS